jgi:hypothetical protein
MLRLMGDRDAYRGEKKRVGSIYSLNFIMELKMQIRAILDLSFKTRRRKIEDGFNAFIKIGNREEPFCTTSSDPSPIRR